MAPPRDPVVVRERAAAPMRPGASLGTDEVSRHAVRLVVIPRAGALRRLVRAFAELSTLLRAGDVLIVNDAATLPGSLVGRTRGGRGVRAAVVGADRRHAVARRAARRRRSSDAHRASRGAAIDRDRRARRGRRGRGARHRRSASASAALERRSRSRMRVALSMRSGRRCTRAGRPIQYAHRSEPLPLWSVQTAYASRPWAAEMPSAGRPLDVGRAAPAARRAGIDDRDAHARGRA